MKEVPCDNDVEAVSTKEIGQVAHHGSREHFGDAVAAHCQPILRRSVSTTRQVHVLVPNMPELGFFFEEEGTNEPICRSTPTPT